MNWKLSLPVGLALAILAMNVRASSDDDPVRFKSSDIIMIVHHGNTSATLVTGWNPIDTPKQMTCKSSSGCLIVLASEADVQHTGGVKVCSFVDGVVAKPKCQLDTNIGNMAIMRASARVSAGNHTVETKVYSINPFGNLGVWQFEYTLYELK